MTAPIGATVRIHVDLVAPVALGDVVKTTSGRSYRVLGVRVQLRGKHAGRQHLVCLVTDGKMTVREWASTTIHRIRWYPRAKRRR
jgi:hypothetical protein